MSEKRAVGKHEYQVTLAGVAHMADLGALDAAGWEVVGFSGDRVLLRRLVKR